MVSRKVFCGASNPFMTGMASGRGFEARPQGSVQRGQAGGGALPAGPGRPMRPPASSPPSRRRPRRRLSALNPAALRWSRRRLGPPPPPPGPGSFPRARPAPATWPAPGGAASNTLTALGCPPPGGERPTRVSPGENLGHAHLELKPREVGRGLTDGHAHRPGWPRPHEYFPGGSCASAPRVSPRAAHAGKSGLVHSATCWTLRYFAALPPPRLRQLPVLQCETARVEEVSSARGASMGRQETHILFYYYYYFLCPFWAAPAARGASQARGPIGAAAAGLQPGPQQHRIRAGSATHTTAHCNAGSSTP